jgi:hypothetical protein
VKKSGEFIRAREASLILSGFWLGACDSHRFFHGSGPQFLTASHGAARFEELLDAYLAGGSK